MKEFNRRSFLQLTSTAALTALTPALFRASAAETPARKMTICLSCGAIGVSANQLEAIRLAKKFGFESVEPYTDAIAKMSEDKLAELLSQMKSDGLVFGCAGLPLEFRGDETRFAESLKRLPATAQGLQRAGIGRLGTWLTPGENKRTYLENFRVHARRLREAANILKDHGQRLGLEYVGTKTSREHARYPFIHTMAEMKELITEIGTGNVGFVLDSWHWWQADDTEADLLSLRNDDVVSVDLNDAPAGLDKDKQLDGRRELPASTGVIDVGAFLKALQQIGYDGPVRAEPFNKALNDLDNEPACAATIAAMKKAFALVT